MPLEEGVFSMLASGAFAVIGTAVVTVLVLLFKNGHNRQLYSWMIAHLSFFSVAILFALQAIRIDPTHPMASETASLQIGIAGVVWALSMVCLLIGIKKCT